MYGKKNVVKGWGYCDNCGRYGKHTSYDGRKWGHLYFIPIIPEGGHVRVLKECSKCSHGMHIPEKELHGMRQDMKQSSGNALEALLKGEEEFDDKGSKASCISCLVGVIELLHCLGEAEYAHGLLVDLQEKNQTYAYHLVNGEFCEFQGNPQKAAESYQQAVECEPEKINGLMSLGSIHLMKNDLDNAMAVYEKALEVAEEKIDVHKVLLGIYESKKDYNKLTETYEECFKLSPELTQNKKIFKTYKKACKKAGIQPISL